MAGAERAAQAEQPSNDCVTSFIRMAARAAGTLLCGRTQTLAST